jgi:hypothetical protein
MEDFEMRYDDPARPQSIGADASPMQANGSPLPVVTLIRPMESEGEEVARCSFAEGCKGYLLADQDGVPFGVPNEGDPLPSGCPSCAVVRPSRWGWLACIHAHREGSRFGYHTAWIADLGEFTTAYLADPEAALARWFKYLGPEARKPIPREVAPDLWGVE